MRRQFCIQIATAFLLTASTAVAQNLKVNFTVDISKDRIPISPYIFGTNGQSDDSDENITARRAGGNRWTGYNWENNASNAGSDYIHHSDDYMTYQLPAAVQNIPGIAALAFHEESQKIGAYSLVTLQAAGFVARDKNGTVEQSQTAPSNRWDEVKFQKGSAFSLVPNTGDGFVYTDEEVNYLVNRLGSSATTGIKGYSVDNEPSLWPSTHPRIHPAQTTCKEVIDKTVGIAKAVKSVDPTAEIFGPAMFGFSEYMKNQDAPDWNQYQSYGTWVNAYLAKMKEEEDKAGKRLLDVLDLHWYPEAQGKDKNGNNVRIALSSNSDPGVAKARIDAPRSLWDSSYTEDSWIGQYFSPVALFPSLRASIDKYYPGTKLAFTEINYGGDHHISGAIAMADVLGLFTKYGVYMANYWEPVEDYVSAAYKLYRNYDGNKSTYGNENVRATTDDKVNSSIYASLSNDGKLHVILINKNAKDSLEVNLTDIQQSYTAKDLYKIDAMSSMIVHQDVPVQLGLFTTRYTMPPLSIHHLVFEKATSSSVKSNIASGIGLNLFIHGHDLSAQLDIQQEEDITFKIYDIMGREVTSMPYNAHAGNNSFSIPVASLSQGSYFARVITKESTVSKMFSIVR